jgi:glycerol-3-phosphate dehydrogenase subunit B
MLDLLVIGGGLSGLTAAIYAAQAGLSVRVVAKGMSALHWAAGTVDLLGYLPDGTPVDAPLTALDALPAHHPLRRVGADALRQTLSDLQTWLAAEGLDYRQAEREANLWLPTALGSKRPTFLAPVTQATARLDDPAPLLIVGIDHFNDFYPTLIAENLRSQGHEARGHTLPLSLFTERRTVINEVILAESLEDLNRVDAIAEVLRPLIAPGERVVFPAILGLSRHNDVVARLANALGAPVAEIPTLPPSVPGMRLHRALVRKLARHGGRFESNMPAVEFGMNTSASGSDALLAAQTGARGEISWVATSTSARPLRHRARAYLLATGGILGAGINSDHNGRVWETVFDLPLFTPESRGQWFQPEFLDAAGHPIFQAGVQVNDAWQPVDGQGRVVHSNLWTAGNLLAHADTIRTRSREALALASGAAAARALLNDYQPVQRRP